MLMLRTKAKRVPSCWAHEASKEKNRKRFKATRAFLKQNTEEFCRNTSLHGLKYLTNRDLYPFERIFFAISLVAVLCGSCFFGFKIYDKWNTTPVILTISPEPTFITMDPFPAVTICNLNQAYKYKAEEFSIYSAEYALIQMLCHREVNVTIADTITDWSNLRDFIVNISQPCHKMFLNCRFGAEDYNCSELFRPIVTDNGLCCTFNMVSSKFLYNRHSPLRFNVTDPPGFVSVDWNAEKGYPSHLPEKFVPMTTVGSGESLGLSVTLDVEADEYFCTSSKSIGFKIVLHNANELPSMREIGLLLAPGHETKIRIMSEKTESDLNLRTMNREYRGCIFQDEHNLQVFARYTHHNCVAECVGKRLLATCGCISHFMPPLQGNETICSIYDATCVEQVRMQSMIVKDNGSACPFQCWPSCFDLTFRPSFFTTRLSNFGFHIVNPVIDNISSEYVRRNIAVVHMYFKENSYRSKKQSEFIGFTDFLSSVGGLIGLFFGFSFISVAEFLFYAIIRPCRMAIEAKRRSQVPKPQVSKKHNLHHLDDIVVNRTSAPMQTWRNPDLFSKRGFVKKPLEIAWQPGMEYTP